MTNNLAMNANIFTVIVIVYMMIGKSTFFKCHNTKRGKHVPMWAIYSEFSAKKVLYLHILGGSTVLQETKCTLFRLKASQETFKLS